MHTYEKILGAVSMGWCDKKNKHKDMDPELAVAIAKEVYMEILGLSEGKEPCRCGTPEDCEQHPLPKPPEKKSGESCSDFKECPACKVTFAHLEIPKPKTLFELFEERRNGTWTTAETLMMDLAHIAEDYFKKSEEGA